MADVTVQELVESRGGSATKQELRYVISGTDVRADALTALHDEAPLSHEGLTRNDTDTSLDLVEGRLDMWIATVPYEPATIVPFATGETTFTFDTTGGTQHITQSITTISKTAASGTASDFKGAIGVTSSSVDGVDVVVPVFSFSVTRYIAAADMTTAYMGILYSLTGKVNNGNFIVSVDGQTITFAAGECLFKGVKGSKRKSVGDWEMTFDFAGSPNATSIAIGTITVPAKKGWEYLWVRYADDVDNTRLVKTPVQANVEQVYPTGDFSQLEP